MTGAITVVEGRIAESKADVFEAAYRAVRDSDLPKGFRMSFLIRSASDPELYRIVTVWESRDALDRMRSSTKVPKAVALFSDAGVDPQVSIFEIRQSLP